MAQFEPQTTPLSSDSILARSTTFSREIGLLPAISFAVNAAGPALGGVLPFAIFAGLFPGVNLIQIVLVAAGVSLIFGTIYSAIGGLVPNNGSDYVLVSRIFGGAVGFSMSFTMVILLAFSAGAIITMLPRLVAPGILAGIALIQGGTSADLATAIAQPGTAVIIATVLVALAFGLAILPRQYIRSVLAFGSIITIIAWIWMVISLAGANSIQFPPAWDAAMGLENFISRIDAAEEAGMLQYLDPMLGVFAGGALSLWMFFGSFSLVNVAGEMKKPGRDLPISHLVTVIVLGSLIAGTTFFVRRLVLPTWFASESYLFMQSGSIDAMPWVFFYTTILNPNPIFQVVLSLVWVVGFVTLLQTIFYYASRIIWAWGKDRVFPEGLSFVHPRWRSPLVSTLIFAIIVQVGVVISMQIPRLFLSRAYVIPLMALMILPLAAIVVAAFTKPKWFARAEGIAHWRIGRFPLMALFAVIGIAYLIGAIILLANGRLGILLFTGGEVTLIILLFLAGLAWYSGRRAWLHRSEIELNDVFKTFPPG